MKDETFLPLSFAATILYGLLALAGLLFAAVVAGNPEARNCALLGIGAAYVCQTLATFEPGYPKLHVPVQVTQALSAGLWVLGVLFLF